jgi:primosomal protein N' (replication factor Y) (superfamily II helicase)
MPDFRSGERTFQLLEQVAGRAGRGEAGGRVVIQTYWPLHPAIVAAAAHDPDAFYRGELPLRAALRYPPCGRLARVVLTGRDSADVRRSAESVASALVAAATDGVSVLGPSPAPLARLKDAYRWHVLVKGPAGSDLPGQLWRALSTARSESGVSVAPDVDPMDMM